MKLRSELSDGLEESEISRFKAAGRTDVDLHTDIYARRAVRDTLNPQFC
jgi:hypothetical protein